MGGPQATYFTQAYARFEFADALVIVAGAVVVRDEPEVWFNITPEVNGVRFCEEISPRGIVERNVADAPLNRYSLYPP